MHAVVARSTFPSQNVQNTPCSDHFWKLSCRKSQRRWKSKVLKTDGLGPLLEVEFRKSARRCGAKHIFKSKCTKHTLLGPLLEVEFRKVHAVVARSTFPSENVQNTPCSDHFCLSHLSIHHWFALPFLRHSNAPLL